MKMDDKQDSKQNADATEKDANLSTNPIFDNPRGGRNLNAEDLEAEDGDSDDTATARNNPIFDNPRGRG